MCPTSTPRQRCSSSLTGTMQEPTTFSISLLTFETSAISDMLSSTSGTLTPLSPSQVTHTHTHTHFRDPYSIVALAGRRHVLCGTCIHLVATLFVHVHVCYGTLNLQTPFSRPPHHTQPEEFSGKRWEHFKSDKVCEVAYGRIQGKAMLMEHFRSSRLIHKHEKYCPLVLP